MPIHLTDTSDTTLADPWTVIDSEYAHTFSNVDDALGYVKDLFEKGEFEVTIKRAY